MEINDNQLKRKDMKKIILMMLTLAGCLLNTACSDDEWGNDNAEMAHVYYYGPQVWGYDSNKTGNNNVVFYHVNRGETVEIPMQFWCEFVRSYDVETFYYVTPKPAGQKYYYDVTNKNQLAYDGPELVRGVDYEVVDESGNTLSPNADGAFVMSWPNARKGVKNIYIKALNGKTGAFNLQTFDPNSDVTLSNQDVSTTIQNKTGDYEVRIFTQNYRVTVIID